jgi:RHS repeat-associated protein
VSGSEVLGWDGANVAGSADLANQSDGGMNRSFIYDGIDQPLWIIDRNLFNVPRGFGVSGASVYFELDTMGNVRRLRGGLRASNRASLPSDLGGYRYTAFGKLRPPTTTTPFPAVAGNTPPYRQPLLWQGRWAANAEATLYDFRSRVWSTELGAFLQPDQFQYPGPTGTLWSWAGQNPVRWRDPSGRLDPASLAAGIIAAGEAGAAWAAAAVGGAAVAAGGVGYALGYGAIGPCLFAEQDRVLNQRAKDEFEKAKERERQAGGGPADCPPTDRRCRETTAEQDASGERLG